LLLSRRIADAQAPYELRDGSWDDHREAFADRCFDLLHEYAPNFKRAVIDRQVLTPLDLERVFNLTGGNIFQGAMTPRSALRLPSGARTLTLPDAAPRPVPVRRRRPPRRRCDGYTRPQCRTRDPGSASPARSQRELAHKGPRIQVGKRRLFRRPSQ